MNLLIPIALFALIAFIVYITTTHNYKIKKEIIERGGNIDITKKKHVFLEIGLCVVGLGLGLALSVIPQSTDMAEDVKGMLTAALILLCSGLGLITAFFIRRSIERQK